MNVEIWVRMAPIGSQIRMLDPQFREAFGKD